MSKGLEKRLSRVEQRLAERTEAPVVCNCRSVTSFHSGKCLNAILKGVSRVCPVHGFREFGFFMFSSNQYPLNAEDNQFCLCPPDPWRSFVLNGPHTWEGNQAAREACGKLPPDDSFNFQEDKRLLGAVLAKYEEDRRQWQEKTGQRPASPEEIRKLEWKGARKHVG